MVSPSTIRRTGTWTECWGHWQEKNLHTPGGSSDPVGDCPGRRKRMGLKEHNAHCSHLTQALLPDLGHRKAAD